MQPHIARWSFPQPLPMPAIMMSASPAALALYRHRRFG